jgi:hypothetical protein
VRDPLLIERRGFIAGAVGVAATALSGCASPAKIRHYEFAVAVRVAAQLITGSVVQQFLFRSEQGGIVAPKSADFGPEGEALAIPLGGDLGVLVSTFRKLSEADEENPSGTPFFAGKELKSGEGWDPLAPLVRGLLPDGGDGLNRFEKWQAVMELPERSDWIESRLNELPLLVRFTDAADPASAAWVNPEGRGNPVTLVRAATRLTDAPLTRGALTEALPWLADLGVSGRPFSVVPGREMRSVSELLNQYDLRLKPRG